MKIKDAQQGPDLFTAYMEHLHKWMPIDGVWQTAWGNSDGPQGLKRGGWDNLFDSEVTPVLDGYQPAAGPHGQWHVAGSGKWLPVWKLSSLFSLAGRSPKVGFGHVCLTEGVCDDLTAHQIQSLKVITEEGPMKKKRRSNG